MSELGDAWFCSNQERVREGLVLPLAVVSPPLSSRKGEKRRLEAGVGRMSIGAAVYGPAGTSEWSKVASG